MFSISVEIFSIELLIVSIPPHLGVVVFVSPSITSPTNLSKEHSLSANPTKIEFDLLNQ